eukprot:TRINITY_DN29789_c0_g1_i1.p1 TRINITY_DN29789_c0_g1~~TRINITY_DN29789_c0_g1_i1.p1  ORF type:complete len:470 (+),score=116.54 TRINITY_DN29789_c0_g1_i1:36-1445(+)
MRSMAALLVLGTCACATGSRTPGQIRAAEDFERTAKWVVAEGGMVSPKMRQSWGDRLNFMDVHEGVAKGEVLARIPYSLTVMPGVALEDGAVSGIPKKGSMAEQITAVAAALKAVNDGVAVKAQPLLKRVDTIKKAEDASAYTAHWGLGYMAHKHLVCLKEYADISGSAIEATIEELEAGVDAAAAALGVTTTDARHARNLLVSMDRAELGGLVPVVTPYFASRGVAGNVRVMKKKDGYHLEAEADIPPGGRLHLKVKDKAPEIMVLKHGAHAVNSTSTAARVPIRAAVVPGAKSVPRSRLNCDEGQVYYTGFTGELSPVVGHCAYAALLDEAGLKTFARQDEKSRSDLMVQNRENDKRIKEAQGKVRKYLSEQVDKAREIRKKCPVMFPVPEDKRLGLLAHVWRYVSEFYEAGAFHAIQKVLHSPQFKRREGNVLNVVVDGNGKVVNNNAKSNNPKDGKGGAGSSDEL